MALVIEARLLAGRYEAATLRGDRVEWPPHPARVFCALVAVARSEAETGALRWLEEQAPPQVWASPLEAESTATGFVVTNKTNTSKKGGSQHWPGRTTVERSRVSGVPSSDAFALVWDTSEAPRQVVQVLGELAWRVPYLGRATNPVAFRVHTAPKLRESWQVHAPTSLDSPNDAEVRVPYPGYVQALDDAFVEGRRAWEVARTVPYALLQQEPGTEGAHTPARGPFSTMVAFSLPPRSVRPEGSELLLLTQTLRRAMLARIGDEAAPQICGHAEGGQRHLAYIGLPHVAHPKARGHLVGLGLLLPSDLEAAALAQIRTAVRGEPLRLTMGRRGHIDLTHEPWPTTPLRLTPRFWSAGTRGARCWTTVTPLMLDRFTRRNSDLAEFVARSVVTAGYPPPTDVKISSAPLVTGGLHRPAPGTYPPNRPRRKLLHARILFDTPVVGPVLVGSLRYLGLGLFMPHDHLLKEAPRDQA